MAMDTEIMGKILTELVLGTSKADSRYVTDEATSKFWDQLEVEVAALPEGAVIDAPSEMPDVPPASAPSVVVQAPAMNCSLTSGMPSPSMSRSLRPTR